MTLRHILLPCLLGVSCSAAPPDTRQGQVELYAITEFGKSLPAFAEAASTYPLAEADFSVAFRDAILQQIRSEADPIAGWEKFYADAVDHIIESYPPDCQMSYLRFIDWRPWELKAIEANRIENDDERFTLNRYLSVCNVLHDGAVRPQHVITELYINQQLDWRAYWTLNEQLKFVIRIDFFQFDGATPEQPIRVYKEREESLPEGYTLAFVERYAEQREREFSGMVGLDVPPPNVAAGQGMDAPTAVISGTATSPQLATSPTLRNQQGVRSGE